MILDSQAVFLRAGKIGPPESPLPKNYTASSNLAARFCWCWEIGSVQSTSHATVGLCTAPLPTQRFR
jgi:hypothetical protein